MRSQAQRDSVRKAAAVSAQNRAEGARRRRARTERLDRYERLCDCGAGRTPVHSHHCAVWR